MSSAESERPADTTALVDLVADAAAATRPLEVLGAGTKGTFGRPVEAACHVSTAGLAGITLYEPDELVMTARAGTPLARIEAELAERGQELGFEPADYGALLGQAPGSQTIGGVFAANLSGPRRPKGGAARDHLLGLQCVTGYGQVIKTGGRVVKNVTGYDLCKLLTGSFGTLAILAEVTFKVLPRAETSRTLLATGPEETALLDLLRDASGSPCEISGAAYLPALAAGRSEVGFVNAAGCRLAAVRLEGFGPSVTYRMAELTRLLARPGVDFAELDHAATATLWREIRDVKLLTPDRPLWRLSLPPTAAGELAAWTAELTHERLFDWAGGLVWLAVRPEWAGKANVIRAALEGRGGHATLVRAPLPMRAEVDPFEPQPAPLRALTERVKRSFDPQGILNPGRMYAGL